MLVLVTELPPELLDDNAKSNQLVISEEQKLAVVAGGMFWTELAGPEVAGVPCSKFKFLTEVDRVSADAEELSTLGHNDGDTVTRLLHIQAVNQTDPVSKSENHSTMMTYCEEWGTQKTHTLSELLC